MEAAVGAHVHVRPAGEEIGQDVVVARDGGAVEIFVVGYPAADFGVEAFDLRHAIDGRFFFWFVFFPVVEVFRVQHVCYLFVDLYEAAAFFVEFAFSAEVGEVAADVGAGDDFPSAIGLFVEDA